MRACRRDDEPLPRGAAGHGVFLREAEAFHFVVVLAYACHIAAEGQGRDAVFGLAALHLPDLRAHADGKGDDADLEGTEGDEVPEFVEEDEAAEYEDDG